MANRHSICINTFKSVWKKVFAENETLGISIIAHEHFHNLQGQLVCLPGPGKHTYQWFVEGGATYVG